MCTHIFNYSKYYVIILISVLLQTAVYAQDSTVQLTGSVLNAENNNPLIGAHVRLLHANKATIANKDGDFTFKNLPKGVYIIKITNIGFKEVADTLELKKSVHRTYLMQRDLNHLEALTVTSQKYVDRQNTTVSAVVMDEQEIEKYDDINIGQSLRRLPGISVGGPVGQAKDVRMRGLDKEYTQVLMNGRALPGDGEKREFKVNRIPASMIERIEVLRSTNATVNSQGVGGSINIITKSIPERKFIEGSLGGGMVGSEDGNGDAFVQYGNRYGDNMGLLVNGSLQLNNFPKFKEKKKFDAPGSLKELEIENEDVQQTNLSFAPKFVYKPNNKNQFTVDPLLFYTDEEKDKSKNKFEDLDLTTLKEQEIEDESERLYTYRLGGRYKHWFSNSANISTYSYLEVTDKNKEKIKEKFKGDALELDKTEVEDEDKRNREFDIGVTSQIFLGNKHNLQLGVESIFRDRDKFKEKIEIKNGERKDKSKPKDQFQLEEAYGAFYIQDTYQFLPRHRLVLGVRSEFVDNTAVSQDGTTTSQNEFLINPSLNYLYQVNSMYNVRFSITRTVRRPKFDDIVPFTETDEGTLLKPDKVGNPNLETETSLNFEVGIERFGSNGQVIGISAFRKNIDDVIEKNLRFDEGRDRYEEIPVNVGNGHLMGLEVDARSRLSFIGLQNVELHGNVSLFDSKLNLPNTDRSRSFNKQPDYLMNVGMDHFLPSVNMAWGANLSQTPEFGKTEFKDGGLEVEEENEADMLSLYLRKDISDRFTLLFSASNLLDDSKNKFKRKLNGDGSLKELEDEFEDSARRFFLTLKAQF